MAERRMFAKTIIDSDAFLEMPNSTQLLYFHLSMRADDEGFINKPRSIMRMIGAKDDDMKLLIAKKFVIIFDSGVVVIKHWRIHNMIRSDRFKETNYKFEKSTLYLDENNCYSENPQDGIPSGNQMTTNGIPNDNQVTTNCQPNDNQWLEVGNPRLGEDRTGEFSLIQSNTGEERGAGGNPRPDGTGETNVDTWMRMHPGEPVPPCVYDIDKVMFGGGLYEK